MMDVTKVAAGSAYGSPFVGENPNRTAAVDVNIANLTTAEVDLYGYVKPGVPLTRAGALLGSGDAIYGVTIAASKVAVSNSSGDRTGTKRIIVATECLLNRDAGEDILGRAYNANELAAFGTGPCQITNT